MATERDGGMRDAAGADRGQPRSGQDDKGGGGGGFGGTRNPNQGVRVGNPYGNSMAPIGSGFGVGPGTQGPAAPGQQPSQAGRADPGYSPKSFTGDPVFDAWTKIAGVLMGPLGYGMMATQALQAMGFESKETDVDANRRGSATGNDGGNGQVSPGSLLFGGTTGTTGTQPDQNSQQQDQTTQSAAAPPVVNPELANILQQQRRLAAQRGTVLGSALGLPSAANTANKTAMGV